MQTILDILANDGAVRLEIVEKLTDDQYAFLANVSQLDKSGSDLQRVVTQWARLEYLTIRAITPASLALKSAA